MGKIKNLLKEITDPMSGYNILELGVIEKIMTKGRSVIIMVNLPKYGHVVRDYIIGEIKTKLIQLPYINNVIVEVSNKVLRYPFM